MVGRRHRLDQDRAALVDILRERVDPEMAADAGRLLLDQAKVRERSVRALLDHLLADESALVAPSPQCPVALPRLLRVLGSAGYGSQVTLLACVRCGRTDRDLTRRTTQGRSCQRCAQLAAAQQCTICGRGRLVAARTDSGPICTTCYQPPPRTCGVCGETRPIHASATKDRPDLCSRCLQPR